MSQHFFKRNVNNCLICAIKPLIYFGFTITYIGKPKCPHANNTDKPRIEENFASTSLAKLCNLFLLADVIYVVYKLYKTDNLSVQPKFYYNVILPNYINTLNYTFGFLRSNSRHIKYTNGIITLIDRSKFFGVDSVLTKRLTRLLQLWSSILFYVMLAVCLVIFITTTPKELSVESVLFATSMLVNNINAMSFAIYGITTLMVYRVLFKACYDSIYKILKQPLHRQMLVCISFQESLQFQQQFYIAICNNYKHVFGFGTVLFYSGQFVFTVISVVQAYFSAFKTVGSEGAWIIFFSKFFHIFLAVTTFVICLQINYIQFMSQDLVSFVYKYKINKLTITEASQVEMLLITLKTKVPILTASNMYKIGINLLASTSGSAVTYVLVALQFHASFST